jgi:hypothetical protein
MRITLKAALATLFLAIVAFGAKPDLSATIAKVANLQDQLAKNELILKTERANMPASNLRVLQFEAKKLELQKELDKLYDQLPKELRSQAREQQRQMLQAVLPGMPSSSPAPVSAPSTSSTSAPATPPALPLAPTAKTKTMDPINCESYPDPRDKVICYGAKRAEAEAKEKDARKKVAKSDPPAMKKVREEEAKLSTRERKQQNEKNWILQHAALRGCPGGAIVLGNYENVQPAAGDQRVIIYQDAFTHDWGFNHVVTRATNRRPTPVDIVMNGEVVVQNLGSGCSISLNKMIELGLGDTPVQYVAEGRSGGEGVTVSQGPYITLNSTSGTNLKQVQNWVIY